MATKRRIGPLFLLIVLIHQTVAITNRNKDDIKSNSPQSRAPLRDNDALRYNREVGKTDKYKHFERGKLRDRQKVERDTQTLGSKQFENSFYGPPEETDINFQGYGHGTTYVSTMPFGASHDDKDLNAFHRPMYNLPPYHGVQPYAPDPHTLALKSLFLPLAGVALLGAAAALATNPVLLQLGVISGRRKRSIDVNLKDRIVSAINRDKF